MTPASSVLPTRVGVGGGAPAVVGQLDAAGVDLVVDLLDLVVAQVGVLEDVGQVGEVHAGVILVALDE